MDDVIISNHKKYFSRTIIMKCHYCHTSYLYNGLRFFPQTDHLDWTSMAKSELVQYKEAQLALPSLRRCKYQSWDSDVCEN